MDPDTGMTHLRHNTDRVVLHSTKRGPRRAPHHGRYVCSATQKPTPQTPTKPRIVADGQQRTMPTSVATESKSSENCMK